jgi:hypothetical protein
MRRAVVAAYDWCEGGRGKAENWGGKGGEQYNKNPTRECQVVFYVINLGFLSMPSFGKLFFFIPQTLLFSPLSFTSYPFLSSAHLKQSSYCNP